MIRRFSPWIVLAWIAVCAALFIALRGAEDPSRPKGRILSIEAGNRALQLMQARDARYRDYEVVHVAFARRGEGGTDDRWVVLLDRVPHTRLRESVVVELRAGDGALLNVRQPIE